MMIKTPVHASTDGLDYDDNVIYEKYVFDENGDFVCESDSPEFALEIVKRINLHDELVKSLREMVEIIGANFCSNQEIKQKYRAAFNLINDLEQCKNWCTPIESPEEKARRERDAWAKKASQFIDDELDCVNIVGEHVMRRFYNALKSGELPMPVKDGE